MWCMKVAWYSAGVSSFIACWLTKDIDKIIYTHIEDQHPDTLRFLKDCEQLLGREITILQSERFATVEDVIRKVRYVNGPHGAPCTRMLKRQVRKEWEAENPVRHTYVWGYDCTERHRADRIREGMPEHNHEFPLIEKNLTKEDCHGIAKQFGLRRPAMYDLGYRNNNCIGCVKGGMGYWNKIRKDFPEVFEARAKLEREIGHSCIRGVFLDELDPDRGKAETEIMEECGIICQISMS